MARKINWESQIGRRIKLRHLHVFVAVAQRGSMAKAAAQLNVSQPAVSEIMSELEQAVGVRLLDRSSHGVEPTIYGRAMLARSLAVFDELKQGVQTIEHLTDPAMGEVRIGCSESLVSAILAPVIPQFLLRFPRVQINVDDVLTFTLDLPALRERRLDVVLARLVRPCVDDELNTEVLFNDVMVVAAGAQSPLAKRRSIDFAELVDHPWILPPRDSWNYATVAAAFRAHGLDMPKTCLTTFSIHLRNDLLATGRFITAYPKSCVTVNGERFALKILPVDIPTRPWPVEIITVKNRTLNPAVHHFIQHLRAFAAPMTQQTPIGHQQSAQIVAAR